MPGADSPSSPINDSTHIDISSEDLLTEDQIAEAQAMLAEGPPRSTVTFAQLLLYAEQYIGLPYVWGGKHPSEGGFDCSGFVSWIFNNVAGTNINSYMTSAAGIYQSYCTPVSEAAACPGDLVFWKGTYGSNKNYITHVGLYCGNGITLNAGDPIGYDPVDAVKNVEGQTAIRVYGRMKGSR
ncbi:MAG: C40 family peptidase [Collinsella sp.]|nr:C40 family peptidase [Collinsella sp.]